MTLEHPLVGSVGERPEPGGPSGPSSEGLPDELMAYMDGTCPAKAVGFTLQLLTADADGWPRVALLSLGEVLAVSETLLRMALWPQSRTTGNLTRSGQATLAFVHEGAGYSLRLALCREADLAGPPLRAVFASAIVEVRRDAVLYATLSSGITFELDQPADVLARWKETIEQLRARPVTDVLTAGHGER